MKKYKYFGVVFIVLFVCFLVSCSNKTENANEYYLNEQGHLIAQYEDGKEVDLGKFDESIIDSLTSITFSDNLYYIINNVKTNINVNDHIISIVNGITISGDGYYVINGIKTGLNAKDDVADNVKTITISDDGYYIVNGIKIDILAKASFTIKFSTGFSTKLPDQTVLEDNKVTRPLLERPGYTLNGWFVNGEEWRFNSDIVDSDMTMTSSWTPNTYNISFITNNEDELDDVTVTFDEIVQLPELQKDGYTFDGWFNNNVKVNNGSWKIADDVTLVAKWTRDSYTISFNSNGGPSIPSITVDSYSTVESLPQPTRQDYEFLGWHLDGELFETPYFITNHGIELEARWRGVTEKFDFTDDVAGTGVKITKYKGNEKNVIVPEKIAGKFVTTIAANSFDYSLIESITLPAKLTEFEYKSFNNLVNLKELSISGDTKSTLIYIFGGEVNIPSSLDVINFVNGSSTYGKGIFHSISSTRTFIVNVPSSLKVTPEDAFFGSPNIREVHFPEGITTISLRTVASMPNLDYVNIPSTVTTIGMNVFINIPKVKYLIVPKSVTNVGYAGLSAGDAIILIEAKTRPSSWGSSVFSIYEDEMQIYYGFVEIKENDDFIYAICEVGSFKQSVIIENKTSTFIPELIDGYPVAK